MMLTSREQVALRFTEIMLSQYDAEDIAQIFGGYKGLFNRAFEYADMFLDSRDGINHG